MDKVESDSDPFSFDFSDIVDAHGSASGSATPLGSRNSMGNKVKPEVFFFEKAKVSLGKTVDLYDADSYFSQKKITHLNKNKELIESDTHGFVLVRLAKDGRYVIATKKGESSPFKGKDGVLHRGSEAKGKRRERLKNKNIVLVEMSDEQYANVSSYARDVFSRISSKVKNEGEKKGLEGEASHKLLNRSKKFPEGTLERDVTKWLRDSELIDHFKENRVSIDETEEQWREEKEGIRRKREKKEEKFEQVMANVEMKEENMEIIKEKVENDELKAEDFLDDEIDK